jgi:hypothetical protein
VWAPLNVKNIFFQNRFIENTKPIAQIWNHKSLTPYKNKWGTILHKEKAYPTEGYQ